MSGWRYALRGHQRDRINDFLPGRKGFVGVTARDNRLFVEAVLYRYRAGIPWRDLPERFGNFRVVHTRFSRRSKKGMGPESLKLASERVRQCYGSPYSMAIAQLNHIESKAVQFKEEPTSPVKIV